MPKREYWHPVSEKWPLHCLVWVWDTTLYRAVLAKCTDGVHWEGPPSNPRNLVVSHWQHITVPDPP
jgi:hypothetical protein